MASVPLTRQNSLGRDFVLVLVPVLVPMLVPMLA